MRKRLGEILVELGFIGEDQLRTALQEAQSTGELLGDVLVRLGWLTHDELNVALAAQSGAPVLDTEHLNVDMSVFSKVPVDIAKEHLLLPFAEDGPLLKVAMANPYDVLARDKLQELTGCTVESYIASPEWLRRAIDFYYGTAARLDDEVKALIREITVRKKEGPEETQNIRLLELLITKGIVSGASDIHFDPDGKVLRISYRIDGAMHQEYLLPHLLHAGLLTRIKVLSDIPIADPNVPHDGRMVFQSGIQEVPVRVSTLPTQYGEAAVLRLLQKAEAVGDMEALGLTKHNREIFERIIHRPHGLILVTGPTGSGKTTTLYTVLLRINTPTNNIITIEDPIEYRIPTVRQTAVNPKTGFTFASALRSALRQDPDIIMVGEIRDQETGELALRAAITGHLVLSTLHTNDAPSAIYRLLDLGVSPSILTSALIAVVAQRLVRRLCSDCKKPTEVDEATRRLLKAYGYPEDTVLFGANGCDKCRGTGYKGRIAIFEIMEMNSEIEELILSGSSRSRILEAAARAGMRRLLEDGIGKAAAGLTSISEVLRVVGQ